MKRTSRVESESVITIDELLMNLKERGQFPGEPVKIEGSQIHHGDVQRPADQDSSRQSCLTPRNPNGLSHKVLFGTSSSCDSRTPISTGRTESSTVVTTRCCVWRVSCSGRRETTNVLWRSLNGWHRVMIYCVTLCWSEYLFPIYFFCLIWMNEAKSK